MIEKKYNYTLSQDKTIEKLVLDDNVNIMHMILPQGDALPEHYTNSNVYMIVISGKLSLTLDEQETHEYKKGDILNIPYNTKMNAKNNYEETTELFVVKSPLQSTTRNNAK